MCFPSLTAGRLLVKVSWYPNQYNLPSKSNYQHVIWPKASQSLEMQILSLIGLLLLELKLVIWSQQAIQGHRLQYFSYIFMKRTNSMLWKGSRKDNSENLTDYINWPSTFLSRIRCTLFMKITRHQIHILRNNGCTSSQVSKQDDSTPQECGSLKII